MPLIIDPGNRLKNGLAALSVLGNNYLGNNNLSSYLSESGYSYYRLVPRITIVFYNYLFLTPSFLLTIKKKTKQ